MTENDQGHRQARRSHVRNEVVPLEIKGLLNAPGGIHQPFLIWDLSEQGLGIWVPDRMEVGTEIVMNVAVPRKCVIKGKVSWCEEAHDLQGWRCGVVAPGDSEIIKGLMRDVAQARATMTSGPVSRL